MEDEIPKGKPPLNIWNNIERCWVMRLDLVFEGQTIAGIHHSDFEDIVNDIDWLCKKLQQYKSEMQCEYENKSPVKNSLIKTYLYMVKDESNGLVKIGRSINPNFREKTLQSERPSYKTIWVSKLVEKSLEKQLHEVFKAKRVRGEWFSLTDDDVIWIMNHEQF